jgi:hypothetical protein
MSSQMKFSHHHHIQRELSGADLHHSISLFSTKWTHNGVLYQCELCETGELSTKEYMKHRDCPEHVALVTKLHRTQVHYLNNKCALYQCRVDQLPFQAWRLDVQDKLYWVLLHHQADEFICNDAMLSLEQIQKQIEGYEHRARCHLLGLAVWKSVCLTSCDRLGCKLQSFFHWQDWAQHGWKSKKNEMRWANEIGIVVKLVLPFVGEELHD